MSRNPVLRLPRVSASPVDRGVAEESGHVGVGDRLRCTRDCQPILDQLCVTNLYSYQSERNCVERMQLASQTVPFRCVMVDLAIPKLLSVSIVDTKPTQYCNQSGKF